jgi:hypothetical protein
MFSILLFSKIRQKHTVYSRKYTVYSRMQRYTSVTQEFTKTKIIMFQSIGIHQYEVKLRIIRQVKYNFDHYILYMEYHLDYYMNE